MVYRPEDILEEVAALAADAGPALMPAVHEELLRSITAAALALFEAEACSLALLDEERNELVFWATSGGRAGTVDGMRVPVGHGIAGWVMASGQALAVEDVASDPRFARDVAQSLGHIPRTIVAVPLETDRALLGVIEVLDPARGLADRMDLLGLFARQAALGIESGRTFTALGRTLFEAASRAADRSDLGRVLAEFAQRAPDPQRELAQVVLLLRELRDAEPDALVLAAKVLIELLAFVRGRGPTP